MSWTDGYISEIDYTAGYFSELSPLQTRWALTCRGIKTRDLTRPKYLELGFGQGVSFAVHSAVGAGEYWGNDFNPAQAASTLDMIAASGANAHVLDASFAELAKRDDLPEFDMIALHGIWSWISEENRGVIVDIIRRKLAPGGVVYISYNVTPGWSPMVPVRHMLQLHAARTGSEGAGVSARLEAALGFVEKLGDSGALYFKAHPQVLNRLKRFRAKPGKYAVHELMNEHWYPMPFSAIAEELEDAKLSHGANATLLEQIDGLNLSADGQALVSSITDVWLRETVRDFLANTQFRRDYFVRGPRKMPSLAQGEALRQFRVVLAEDPSTITLEVAGSRGTAKLQESVYAPLIEALASDGSRAKSLAELDAATPKLSFGQLVQAVTVLLGKGSACLVQSDAEIEQARPRSRALNRHFMQISRSNSERNHLASPVSGAGVVASRVDQFFLSAHSEGKTRPSEWVDHAWKMLSSQGQRLTLEGKRIEPEEDNRRELTLQAEAFEKLRLPVLTRLEVV
jgi:SAM-dependent methyltransferase